MLDRGAYTAVSVVTAVGARELLQAVGVEAWAQRMTGAPPVVVGLVLALVMALFAFGAWGVMFMLVRGAYGYGNRAPVVLLEVAVILMTTTVATGLLHSACGMSRLLSFVLGAAVSVLVWVPWLHLRPGRWCDSRRVDA